MERTRSSAVWITSGTAAAIRRMPMTTSSRRTQARRARLLPVCLRRVRAPLSHARRGTGLCRMRRFRAARAGLEAPVLPPPGKPPVRR